MQIIAHQGFWLDSSEKNTTTAFARALKHGFGIEIDVRDFDGSLVVSHDLPRVDSMLFSEFLNLYLISSCEGVLAINIKADGLHLLVKKIMIDSGLKNYFVFDMSTPDIRRYLAHELPTFTRLSEYEPNPLFLDKSVGVWLDSFERQWYDFEIINSLLEKNKKVSIVSPELHGRTHYDLWTFLKKNRLDQDSLISLCTDFPLEAKDFFNA